jgi:hypothetical protein
VAGPDGERAADDDPEGDGDAEDAGDWEGRPVPAWEDWCGVRMTAVIVPPATTTGSTASSTRERRARGSRT